MNKELLSVIDRINTLEDVYADQKTKPEEVIPFPNPKNRRERNTNAYAVVGLIADALNENWGPDYEDGNQLKYTPVMVYKSGVGFSDTDCAYWRTHTGVGSRLCFRSHEIMLHFVTKFNKEFNEYLLNK